MKSEDCYETEYDLRQDIHFRKGEIMKLEYQNGAHRRQIVTLNGIVSELSSENKSFEERIGGLETELEIRNVPLMKESLKASARLALRQDDEITKLKADSADSENLFKYVRTEIIRSIIKEGDQVIDSDEIDMEYVKSALRYVIPGLFDPYAFLSEGEKAYVKDRVSVDAASEKDVRNLFEYTKSLIVRLSNEEGNEPIDPNDINIDYVRHAVKYAMPGFFNAYDLLSDDTIHKIEFADKILEKIDIETMAKYIELAERGDVGIEILDRRR